MNPCKIRRRQILKCCCKHVQYQVVLQPLTLNDLCIKIEKIEVKMIKVNFIIINKRKSVVKSVKIWIGLKMTCLGVLKRGDTWQRQWNRFERGRRNRNVNLQCFHYAMLALFTLNTYLRCCHRHCWRLIVNAKIVKKQWPVCLADATTDDVAWPTTSFCLVWFCWVVDCCDYC